MNTNMVRAPISVEAQLFLRKSSRLSISQELHLNWQNIACGMFPTANKLLALRVNQQGSADTRLEPISDPS